MFGSPMSMMAASNTSCLQHFLGTLAAAHPVHGIAGIGQPQLDAAGHHDVVFDQQQAHGEA